MISSEVDDTESPSRAIRFQAIRNFYRSIWIVAWYIWVYVGIFLFSTRVISPNLSQNIPKWVPSVFEEDPALFNVPASPTQVFALLFVVVVTFWYLTDRYEREFIEHLFVDYVVKRKSEAKTLNVRHHWEVEE